MCFIACLPRHILARLCVVRLELLNPASLTAPSELQQSAWSGSPLSAVKTWFLQSPYGPIFTKIGVLVFDSFDFLELESLFDQKLFSATSQQKALAYSVNW